MADLEVDLSVLQAADPAAVVAQLMSAAQTKIALEERNEEHIPPALPAIEDVLAASASHNTSAGSAVATATYSHKVEDRMATWERRRLEKIDILRRQLEEQQRAQEIAAATPIARRFDKAMAESTMMERTREWQRKRDTRIADLKKQLSELEVEGCTFKPQISQYAEASPGLLPAFVKEAVHSPRKPAAKHVDPDEIRQRQQDTIEDFVARQELARRRKAETVAPEPGAHYTGQPTVPKPPSLRTDARAGYAGRLAGMKSPGLAGVGSTGAQTVLVPGPLVGLPEGTYAAVPAETAAALQPALLSPGGPAAGYGSSIAASPAGVASSSLAPAAAAGSYARPSSRPDSMAVPGAATSTPGYSRSNSITTAGAGSYAQAHAAARTQMPLSPEPAAIRPPAAGLAGAGGAGGSYAVAHAPTPGSASSGRYLSSSYLPESAELSAARRASSGATSSVDISSVLQGADRSLRALQAALQDELALAGAGSNHVAVAPQGIAQAPQPYAATAAPVSLLSPAARPLSYVGQLPQVAMATTPVPVAPAQHAVQLPAPAVPLNLGALSARDLYANPALLGLATMRVAGT